MRSYQDGFLTQFEYAADLNFSIPPFGRMSSMQYPRGASYCKELLLLLDFLPPFDSIKTFTMIQIYIFEEVTGSR